MSSINLSSFSQEEKKPAQLTEKSLLGVFLILVLVLAAWSGLFFYGKYLDKKIDQAKQNYQEQIVQLGNEGSKNVIDFQKRLDVSKALIAQGRNIGEDLTQIESLIVPNVYLSGFSYDESGKKISLNCVGDNYNTVAKQILSFKNSSYFSSVAAGSSNIDTQSNKISFPIELRVK